MNRRWIVNASPLITLGRAKRLELLLQLCPAPVVPPSVAAELRAGPESDPARLWLAEAGALLIADSANIDPRIASWDLGAGESEVLSLAMQTPRAEAIVDDRAARNCAMAFHLVARGTLGLALLAKREGLIPNVAPVFDDFIRAGMHISGATLKHALKLADESD